MAGSDPDRRDFSDGDPGNPGVEKVRLNLINQTLYDNITVTVRRRKKQRITASPLHRIKNVEKKKEE